MSKNNKEKVIAVIVSYNPNLEELKNSIVNLLKQVFYVVVVNNSEYNLNFHINRVRIIELGKNFGIAYAQNVGMKWAYSKGANFVLQMDQDSLIQENTVSELLDCYTYLTEMGKNIGIVAGIDYDKDSGLARIPKIFKGKIIEKEKYRSVTEVISSGSLIPKSVYENIGPLMNELFIDWVDSEYCWRAREKGFLVITDYEAKILHKLGFGESKITKSKNFHSPFRLYYMTRNFIALFFRKRMPMHIRFSTIIKFFLNSYFVLASKDLLSRFYYFFKGFINGLSLAFSQK